MSTNNVESIIEQLTGELEPIKRLKHPLVRIMPWSIVAVAYVAGITAIVGVRPDIYQKLGESGFVYEVFIMGFTAITAALASAWLCVPDMRGKKWLVAMPLTSISLFIGWIAARLITGEEPHMPHLHWDTCINEGFLMIALPIIALMVITRRGATTAPVLMSAMNVLSVGSLGYLGMRFTCAMDTIGHCMIYHALPFLAVGIIAGIFARKIYRW